MTRRLVLVGGGHAHLEVLRRLATEPIAGAELVVISPSPFAHYTGMIPGFVRGIYREDELRFDIAALTRAAGGRFMEGCATEIGATGHEVVHEGGHIPCDAISLDVGSMPTMRDAPGVAEFADGARPIGLARRLVERLERIEAGEDADAAVTVVGGGAGGVEIAFAIRARMRRARRDVPVTIVDADAELLSEFEPPVRAAAGRRLAAHGIAVRTGTTVTSVAREAIQLADGTSVPSTITVWLTGAAPRDLTGRSALPTDAAGFWLVDETLRSTGGAPVWGAGDCVTMAEHPWVPKAGVHAVRQAPILAANLRGFVIHGAVARPRRYDPQRSYLAIMDRADGRAIARWRGRAFEGRLPLLVKRFIDRRFITRYRTT